MATSHTTGRQAQSSEIIIAGDDAEIIDAEEK